MLRMHGVHLGVAAAQKDECSRNSLEVFREILDRKRALVISQGLFAEEFLDAYLRTFGTLLVIGKAGIARFVCQLGRGAESLGRAIDQTP